jgi:hypothetical protein
MEVSFNSQAETGKEKGKSAKAEYYRKGQAKRPSTLLC